MMDIYIGASKYIVKNKEIIPFRIDFIGKDEVVMKEDEATTYVKKGDLFETEEEAKNSLLGSELIVICNETSKNSNESTIYKVMNNPNCNDFNVLHLRSLYNLELTYFVMFNQVFNELGIDFISKNIDKLIKEKKLIQL